jgi:predicted AlkP superfamily pyrophosphatase or phosphodiesterase
MERGSFTMWARTTAISVTLPSHVSMLTGVIPGKHRIEWNTDLPLAHPVYPAWPTLFELAHDAGLSTAMAAGKSKFTALQAPGDLDWSYVPEVPIVSDEAVADTVVRWIRRHAPKVLFVHLPTVDIAGHESGWGSRAQLSAIAAADRCIGRFTAALRSRRLLDSTLIIVTADHGGAGFSHGADDVRSQTIPWIAAGPSIRRGLDLTSDASLEIRTEDTFATVCFLLGLMPPKPIDGKPVTQILR